MSIRNKLRTRQRNRNLLKIPIARNQLKSSSVESLSHRITKFWLCTYCWEHGLEFVSEAEFQKGGRADIVITDWGVAIEVLGTEKADDFAKKEYPMITIPISAMMLPGEIISMMDELNNTNGGAADYYIRHNTIELQKSKRTIVRSIRDLEAK